jgi:hypothetical protein
MNNNGKVTTETLLTLVTIITIATLVNAVFINVRWSRVECLLFPPDYNQNESSVQILVKLRNIFHKNFPAVALFFRTDGQAGWQRHDELILGVCSFLRVHLKPKGGGIQK